MDVLRVLWVREVLCTRVLGVLVAASDNSESVTNVDFFAENVRIFNISVTAFFPLNSLLNTVEPGANYTKKPGTCSVQQHRLVDPKVGC